MTEAPMDAAAALKRMVGFAGLLQTVGTEPHRRAVEPSTGAPAPEPLRGGGRALAADVASRGGHRALATHRGVATKGQGADPEHRSLPSIQLNRSKNERAWGGAYENARGTLIQDRSHHTHRNSTGSMINFRGSALIVGGVVEASERRVAVRSVGRAVVPAQTLLGRPQHRALRRARAARTVL